MCVKGNRWLTTPPDFDVDEYIGRNTIDDEHDGLPRTREEIEAHIRELKEHQELTNRMIEHWESVLLGMR